MVEGDKQGRSGSAGLEIRPADECRWDLLALGEVMLRFDPGEGRIRNARSFRVWEGGGEYNVARGLRRCFGLRTTIATALVDNPVGRLIEDLMLQGGVDLSHLKWTGFDGVGRETRNGIYFLERGFGLRAGLGMMDRGHTAISQLQPGEIDWDAIFGQQGGQRDGQQGGQQPGRQTGQHGVRWFHTGGIMAGLSESATETTREAMHSAKRHGAIVSFDCNYRPSLWRGRGGRQGAIEVNRSLLPMVDVLFGHGGDLGLGTAAQGAVWHTRESFGEMAGEVMEHFPTLKAIASPVRRTHSASRNHWSGFAYTGAHCYEASLPGELEILDRVGGGDAFAAGFIYGLMQARGVQWSLDCGVAHGALAMTTPGDSSSATLSEVEQVMAGASAGTNR